MTTYARWLIGIALLALACTGCAPRRTDILHFLREHEHEVSAIEYRVGIPDVVHISAPHVLEIDSEVQRIQPDGKINLRLLGEVKVVGMTAKEIAAKLQVLLSRYYMDPKVRVSLTYASKKFYVKGQAGGLVARQYSGRDTLLDAVVNANVDFRSWISQVKVIRPSHDGTTVRTIKVDVSRMLKAGDWSQNILLEPNDLVVIPPTIGSWIGQRIRELLYPVGPLVQAYTAPASLMDADEVYGGGEDGTRTNFGRGIGGLGGLR